MQAATSRQKALEFFFCLERSKSLCLQESLGFNVQKTSPTQSPWQALSLRSSKLLATERPSNPAPGRSLPYWEKSSRARKDPCGSSKRGEGEEALIPGVFLFRLFFCIVFVCPFS